MDPVINPYTPAAGTAPPTLAGREDLLESVRVAVERVRRGMPAKSLLMVGLRGVGKTVLLDHMRGAAEAAGVLAVPIHARGGRSLPSLLAPELRLAVLRLSRNGKSRECANRALCALAGFAKGLRNKYPDIEVGLDAEPESGLADSGDLAQDAQELFELVGAAAQYADTAVVLFIDELQYVPVPELTALITVLQRCAQRRLPIMLVGAALPQLRRQVENASSSVDRLFEFSQLGPLSPQDAARAIRDPAADLNVQFEDAAVANILAATHCYPYFLQELGKHAWNSALQSPITLQDTRTASLLALAALDENFFRARLIRLTPPLKKYLRAMAELGPGPHRSGDIARALNRPVSALGPTRSHLIAKGMIWSPSHGDTAFTVPRFDEFMRRTWSDNSWRK